MRRWNGWAAATGLTCVLAATGARAASIEIGTASGTPGEDVTVAVSLHTAGATVLGTQNQIQFDRDTPVAAANGTPDCTVNPAIQKGATGFRFLPLGCDPAVDCQSVRVFVLAFDNLEPIDDGAVLYSCRIAIAATAQPGAHPLHIAEVGASGLDGASVPTTGSDGTVEVLQTPVASIDVGSTSGIAGSAGVFTVKLHHLGDPPVDVVGVQNDIHFDALTPIVAASGGRPACTVNPAIDKEATSFTFLPMGCTPGLDCTGARAFVLSTSNTNPIPDGVDLYACSIMIALDAPVGTYALAADGAVGSGALGEVLPVQSSSGAIEVTETLPPICVGDCDDDHSVIINEILLGVNIVNGSAPLSVCSVLDEDDNGSVAINELIQAVNNALSGCPE